MVTHSNSARDAAAQALGKAAARYPRLPPSTLDVAGLDARDARLALAIHRTALQRWITLEYLLDRFLRRPMNTLEAPLRGVLLSGAAQLIFMDRLPPHAVVDESVAVARRLVRPAAAGLVNAVLRKLAAVVEQHVVGKAWSPARDRLPTEDGFVPLVDALLPDTNDIATHLSIATSHPRDLVQHWIGLFGVEETTRMLAHDIVTPPTVVAVEAGFDIASHAHVEAHAEPGFVIWRGANDALTAFLAGSAHRRVQDASSAEAVAATAELPVRTILDYCAGRGTKTRQLAATHPDARIVATDTHPERLKELAAALADVSNVTVMPPQQVRETFGPDREQVDLVLLDVPCSNTGVLARRPEARYRLTARDLDRLVDLQRSIVDQAMPWLSRSGDSSGGSFLLYSTCSVEPTENEEQSAAAAKRWGLQVIRSQSRRPGGSGADYRDGSYFALMKSR